MTLSGKAAVDYTGGKDMGALSLCTRGGVENIVLPTVRIGPFGIGRDIPNEGVSVPRRAAPEGLLAASG